MTKQTEKQQQQKDQKTGGIFKDKEIVPNAKSKGTFLKLLKQLQAAR